MASAKQPPQPQPQPQQQGPRPRILRIGILLGGKIVEERLIRERTAVSIGQSMKNTFSIPIEGLPLEFTLFALDDGKYYLRFLNNMDGRLSDSGGQVNTLDALKGRGAQQQGEYWQVPVSDSSRGKLSLGDLTILFQFVTEPPRQPKPMLPASVRGTFADRIDPRLSVILGISLIAHFAIAIVAMLHDIERRGIAEQAYNLTFEPDKHTVDEVVIPTEPTEAGSGAGSAAAKEPEPTPTKKPSGDGGKTPAKDPGAGRSQNDNVAMNEEDISKFADGLTATGPDGTSDADMSKRRPGTDLGTQITDVKESGRNVTVGGGTGRGSRGDGDPRVGTGGGIKTNGPGGGTIGEGKVVEKGPTGRITPVAKSAEDDSSLSADSVLAKIQRDYMPGIRRCYTNYLKKEASARGKVALSFTVNETGRAVSGKASQFPADEVNSCISGLMQTWRFPIPKDKDNEPTEASFGITLQLVPD